MANIQVSVNTKTNPATINIAIEGILVLTMPQSEYHRLLLDMVAGYNELEEHNRLAQNMKIVQKEE